MKSMMQVAGLLLVTGSCGVAFHVPTTTTTTTSEPRFQRCHHNRRTTIVRPRMMPPVDGIAEVISQATYILADEVSRGGAVVEQIPYVPGEAVMDFPKIVLGSAACVLAYAWAAFEFGSRIVTQRACEVCEGSGLVNTSRSGQKLNQPRKCYACGGFLPWENWGRFWQTNMDVGNGGVLQRPANDYDELNKAAKAAKEGRTADQDDQAPS